MKTLLVVLVQSFILTAFITLMAQASLHTTPTMNCHHGLFNSQKCVSTVEAMRGSLP